MRGGRRPYTAVVARRSRRAQAETAQWGPADFLRAGAKTASERLGVPPQFTERFVQMIADLNDTEPPPNFETAAIVRRGVVPEEAAVACIVDATIQLVIENAPGATAAETLALAMMLAMRFREYGFAASDPLDGSG